MRAEFNGRIVEVIDIETGAYVSGDNSMAYTNPVNLKLLPEILADEVVTVTKRKRQGKIEWLGDRFWASKVYGSILKILGQMRREFDYSTYSLIWYNVHTLEV